MQYSLAGWIGALAGAVIAVVLYVPAIRFIERRMRAQNAAAPGEERAAQDEKLSIVRRLILGFDVAILATLGYWIGKEIGGPLRLPPWR